MDENIGEFEDVGIKNILRFLQLCCEGHNSKLQNLLRLILERYVNLIIEFIHRINNNF
jgi:hypothetical protein